MERSSSESSVSLNSDSRSRLHTPFRETLHDFEAKRELIQALWPTELKWDTSSTVTSGTYSSAVFGINADLNGDVEQLSSYFEYYQNLIMNLDSTDRGIPESLTHAHIVDVVDAIRDNPETPRKDIVRVLQDENSCHCFSKDNHWGSRDVDWVVSVAVSVWLMIRIHKNDEILYMRKEPDEWLENDNLSEYIRKQFQKCLDSRPNESSINTEHFNALDLDRMGGITVVPTTNLVEHLVYDDKRHELAVFHMASFLEKSLGSGESTFLPPDLIRETLDTLALIFPSGATTEQFLKYKKRFENFDRHLSESIIGEPISDLAHYTYWRNRLIHVRDRFERSEPRTFRQFWYDRRKTLQWWTFWFAKAILILTLLFGLISSVTGVMQVMIAMKELEEQRGRPS